ncbi:MAG TPA: response regulator transcription factor [Burkholderiales bacterium]|nr:response regulator transcription factor [Burkholderiales bacterium]
MQVFLVEDSPMVRQRLEALLTEVPGIEIVGRAAGAQVAIRDILEARPDLVVLDVQLAEGSGFDVLRALHAQAPELGVVMLSNYSSDPYRQIAERFGARAFFDKTREFERVRDALAQFAQPSTTTQ